jgi:branched-chain amino acid transport system substrate-binding protein
MKKTTKLVGFVAAAALLAASPAFADDLKLGVLLGFTGPLEAMSPPMEAGAKLAISEVNAAGGVAGQQLGEDAADDTCTTADTAVASADKLINTDKVVAIVGGLCSGVTIAAANSVAIPAGVVMISPSATSPAVTTLDDKDLVFRTAPSDAYNGQVLAKLLWTKGIKDIGITYVNTDYGKGLANSIADAFTADGGKVTANIAHEEGKADYRAELGQLAASGTKNLVAVAYAQGSGHTILQQAIESGDFTTYAGGDGVVDNSLFAGIDTKALEGMVAMKPGSPASPGIAAFEALAKAGNVDPTSTYVPQAYDAAFILALALEKTGGKKDGLSQAVRDVSTAPGDVILPGEWAKAVADIKAGKDINYEGASGPAEFDKAGDVSGVVIEMTAKDGKWVEVGPAAP